LDRDEIWLERFASSVVSPEMFLLASSLSDTKSSDAEGAGSFWPEPAEPPVGCCVKPLPNEDDGTNGLKLEPPVPVRDGLTGEVGVSAEPPAKGSLALEPPVDIGA
jgi:hypothetical protein